MLEKEGDVPFFSRLLHANGSHEVGASARTGSV